MRVLICGSRAWKDSRIIDAILFGWGATTGDDPEYVVIEGGATGADATAAEWARAFMPDPLGGDHRHLQFPADWGTHGRAAGPIRNQRMIDEGKPDVVFAFKDGLLDSWGGTEDLVHRAKAAGIPVYVVSHG